MSKQRRLDQQLTSIYPELSRRQAQGLCDTKRVKVNGKLGRSGQLVSMDDRIEVSGDISPVRARPELGATAVGFAVIFEDDFLIVAHKPAGMHSVRLSHEDPPTLADCLAAHCPATIEASPDLRESGLVNRLDFYTEGLVVAAKNRETWTALRHDTAWSEKRYLALVEGELKEPCVIRSLFRNLQGGERVEVVAGDKFTQADEKQANEKIQKVIANESEELEDDEPLSESRIEPVSSRNGVTLIDISLTTAKRHQVRAHLAWLDHPIVGDELYGSVLRADAGWKSFTGEPLERDQGFLLFAYSLRFQHPQLQEFVEFEDQHPRLATLQAGLN